MIIKLFVTGLAALVPSSPSEVMVLVPDVQSDEWLSECGCHLPTHTAHLAFVCDDWVIESHHLPRIERSLDQRICWVRLDHEEVSVVGVPEQIPQDGEGVNLWWQVNLPRTESQLSAAEWVPRMLDIQGEYAIVDRSLLGYDRSQKLTGRARFQFARHGSCGFAGQHGRDEAGFGVPKYVFKMGRERSSRFRRSQALAAGVLFEADVPEDGAQRLRLRLTKIESEDISFELAINDPSSAREVDLGVVQLVENWEAAKSALMRLLGRDREARDSHFRVYYSLAVDAPQCREGARPAQVRVPFRTHRSRRVDQASLDLACRSKILYGTLSAFRDGAGAFVRYLKEEVGEADEALRLGELYLGGGMDSTPLWADGEIFLDPMISPINAPPEYWAMNLIGPPLCTPLWMEKPQG